MQNEPTDDELCERDERVADSLRYVLEYKRNLAADMRREASELETQARRIEQAVTAGKWWELEGLIDSEDIESLCEISPTKLM